jgi:type II secretory pathway pseudopilin PulG
MARSAPSPRVVVLAMLLALVGTWMLRRARLTHEAESQLRALSSEIEARRATTGAYPEQLADLGWRLFPLFPDGNPIDPWGQPIRYRRTDTGFELGSTGPDGAPSGDDLGRVRR